MTNSKTVPGWPWVRVVLPVVGFIVSACDGQQRAEPGQEYVGESVQALGSDGVAARVTGERSSTTITTGDPFVIPRALSRASLPTAGRTINSPRTRRTTTEPTSGTLANTSPSTLTVSRSRAPKPP